MGVDLKVCPNSPYHHVMGGHPEFVCTDCPTEWVIMNYRGVPHVLYMQYSDSGKVTKRWRVPAPVGLKIKRRSLSA